MSRQLFFLTAAATTLFVVTILAMVAMLIGDAETPLNLWFNRNGAVVLTVEVISIGLFGMAAMICDRRETLQEWKKRSQALSVDRTSPDSSNDA